MVAFHKHPRLDDRDEAGLLTKGGIAGERVCIRFDAGAARAPIIAKSDHRAPLGEPRAHMEIVVKALPQSIESLGDLFPRMAGKIPRTDIDLDAGDDA